MPDGIELGSILVVAPLIVKVIGSISVVWQTAWSIAPELDKIAIVGILPTSRVIDSDAGLPQPPTVIKL